MAKTQRVMKPGWLITHCALCGETFPLTAPLYANMSGTIHQSQLPCPCETRKPFVPRAATEGAVGRPAIGAKVDLDP